MYLILISLILKEIQYIPFLILLGFLFFDKYLPEDFRNLLYVLLAFFPFTSLFSIFLFYLPFVIFGYLLNSKSFIKRYLFGFVISFFSTILIYIISILTDFPLNQATLIFIFYIPVILISVQLFIKHKSSKVFFESFNINSREFIVFISTFFFLILVTNGIINDHNLYMSNGTYVYTKFSSIIDGINDFNEVPQYDPRIGQGEQLFLTDTPVFYSNLAFVNLILKWINPILFFNSMTVFFMFISILGAWLFILSLLSKEPEKIKLTSNIIAILSALSIVLSFTFIQYFESFKQMSSYSVNFFILAMVFSFPRKPMEFISLICALFVSFSLHATNSVGVLLIASSSYLFLLFKNNIKECTKSFFDYLKKNKVLVLTIILIFLFLPLFYLFPGQWSKSYARDTTFPEDFGISYISNSMYRYFNGFFTDENTNPLSLKPTDLRRIDQKEVGPFLTIFGVFSLFMVLLNFKKKLFRNTLIFILAYFSHFLASSFFDAFPFFQVIEYGYRTMVPFFLVMIVSSIAIFIYSLKNKYLKFFFILFFLVGFVTTSFYVKENLNNIHNESFISGETFRNEIAFLKQLPIDGRILSYGFYSNTIDIGLADLTGRYFSRYGYLQWDFTDNVYEKLKGSNSFGTVDKIGLISKNEFASYLRLAGYKYVLLNICTPVGQEALNKLLPGNAQPIYQNPNYQCFVILGVNNTNYAEKISILNEVNPIEYNKSNGYWFVSFNTNKKIHNFNLEPYLEHVSQKATEPEPLSYERVSPTKVNIFGNFKENDWVVFKEEYFPRWKAYMDDKEIPLLATNNRMLLMKTIKGNKITLEYSLLSKEKLVSLLSFISVIGLLILLVWQVSVKKSVSD